MARPGSGCSARRVGPDLVDRCAHSLQVLAHAQGGEKAADLGARRSHGGDVQAVVVIARYQDALEHGLHVHWHGVKALWPSDPSSRAEGAAAKLARCVDAAR